MPQNDPVYLGDFSSLAPFVNLVPHCKLELWEQVKLKVSCNFSMVEAEGIWQTFSSIWPYACATSRSHRVQCSTGLQMNALRGFVGGSFPAFGPEVISTQMRRRSSYSSWQLLWATTADGMALPWTRAESHTGSVAVAEGWQPPATRQQQAGRDSLAAAAASDTTVGWRTRWKVGTGR